MRLLLIAGIEIMEFVWNDKVGNVALTVIAAEDVWEGIGRNAMKENVNLLKTNRVA